VLFSVFYVLAGRLLALIVVRGRGEGSKDVELILLRREISVLRTGRPVSVTSGAGRPAAWAAATSSPMRSTCSLDST